MRTGSPARTPNDPLKNRAVTMRRSHDVRQWDSSLTPARPDPGQTAQGQTTCSVVAQARTLAEKLLAQDLPRRWLHVQGVAREASRLAARLDIEGDSVISAAWLHDIGYSGAVERTGCHQLDGARYLRTIGWPDDVCALVAYHTCARVEVERRGLLEALTSEFVDRSGAARDVLWAADATTGPNGEVFSFAQRIEEVLRRYGADHLVSHSLLTIRPDLQAAIARVGG
jgi:putative nucleotidyltransferase with HDIG domain